MDVTSGLKTWEERQRAEVGFIIAHWISADGVRSQVRSDHRLLDLVNQRGHLPLASAQMEAEWKVGNRKVQTIVS